MIALVWAVGMSAQQIAVVQADGSTTVHSQLVDAIEAAKAGSVIYLPGGSFPIADEVKITKPVTIIGIGGGDKVDNVLVRWNNINEVHVKNNTCEGTVVNQNYIRNPTYFNGAKGEFTNNIAHSIVDLDNETIAYNVFCHSLSGGYRDTHAIKGCDQCAINYNVILDWADGPHSGNSCTAIGNMGWGDWSLDEEFFNASGAESWGEVFVNDARVTPSSSYHFKGIYKQYEHKCGIYAGDGFSDTALPPIPFIVEKSIPQQTDSQGNLNIKVRVRASE